MAGTILVVDCDPVALRETVESLRSSGSDVASAFSFDDAKRALDRDRPHLLITAVRLGAFNGLQLVARSRGRHAGTAAIVVGEESDRGLQADAAQLGASFAVGPLRGAALLALVHRALDARPT